VEFTQLTQFIAGMERILLDHMRQLVWPEKYRREPEYFRECRTGYPQIHQHLARPLNIGRRKQTTPMKRLLGLVLFVTLTQALLAERVTVHGTRSTVNDPETGTQVTKCSGNSGTCFIYYRRTVSDPGPGSVELYTREQVAEVWSYTSVTITTSGAGTTLVTTGTFSGAKRTQ
jgi:hypothetical protein